MEIDMSEADVTDCINLNKININFHKHIGITIDLRLLAKLKSYNAWQSASITLNWTQGEISANSKFQSTN